MIRKRALAMITGLMIGLPVGMLQAQEKMTVKLPENLAEFEMVKIPAGKIKLKIGDIEVEREIKPIWIGKTEVTWDTYGIYAYGLDIHDEKEKMEAIAKTRPSKPYGAPDFGFGYKNFPAVAVTYHSAEMYCKWLSEKTGKKFRLPTEAEWEYACRAGGDGSVDVDKVAWAADPDHEGTHEVAKKQPNAWGIYDMLGNVVEWCIKDPEADKVEKEDPKKNKPVARGGSWKTDKEKLRCDYRQIQQPSWNVTDPQDPKSKWWLSDGTFTGFRVVCEE